MADDLKKRGPFDRTSINLDKPADVTWWCERLQCTEARLRTAVKAVGTSSTKVNEHLKKAK